jgi:alpha-beta hydrolase superfamily lysophospholipase
VLRGWYAPGQRHAVVILVHGGGGNRLQLYPEARILARHGYGFLLYDSRAHGESDGDHRNIRQRHSGSAMQQLFKAAGEPKEL